MTEVARYDRFSKMFQIVDDLDNWHSIDPTEISSPANLLISLRDFLRNDWFTAAHAAQLIDLAIAYRDGVVQ